MSIEEHARNIINAKSECDDWNRYYYCQEQAQAILDALAWISVDERLPEQDDCYLATMNDGNKDVVNYLQDHGGWQIKGVVAWRELV